MSKMSRKEMIRQIVDLTRESDWSSYEIIQTCFLPYIENKTIKKIMDEHFSLEESEEDIEADRRAATQLIAFAEERLKLFARDVIRIDVGESPFLRGRQAKATWSGDVVRVTINGNMKKKYHVYFHTHTKLWEALKTLRRNPKNRDAIKFVLADIRKEARIMLGRYKA